MKIATYLVLFAMIFGGCASPHCTTTPSKASPSVASEKNRLLWDVPKRIKEYMSHYDSVYFLSNQTKAKSDYVGFLRELLNEVVTEYGDRSILDKEELRSIETFGRVQAISEGYIPWTSRGASGFEYTEADKVISLYHGIFRKLIPQMGTCIDYYYGGASPWNEKKIREWQANFDRAVVKSESR